MHVVLRSVRRISWRRERVYSVLWEVLLDFGDREDFRTVHLSIQKHHLHLLVEAANRHALTEGMKSFMTRAARALNRDEGGCGKVFAYRYHATQITTARQARNALSYVLNNWRRHREDFDCAAARRAKLDPYSSALAFTGWTEKFIVPDGHAPLPVAPPRTALLVSEWKRYGRIDPEERPGPLW